MGERKYWREEGHQAMSESVVPPEMDHEQNQNQAVLYPEGQQVPQIDELAERPAPGMATIWTPRFFLLFSLILVLGLSAASLLTQGWFTSLYRADWLIPTQILLAACSWLGLGKVTRSRRVRLGSLFGVLSSLFLLLTVLLNLQGLSPAAPLQSYLNVATCMAFLGASIGVSSKSTLLTTWDTWLFFLVPVLTAIGVALTYYLTPLASVLTSENALATAALIASCLFWWFRPSCWQKLPGPTFLFGLVPVILLALAGVNHSLHSFFLMQVTWPHIDVLRNANNFFFAQVVQLCLILGCLRMIRGEKSDQLH